MEGRGDPNFLREIGRDDLVIVRDEDEEEFRDQTAVEEYQYRKKEVTRNDKRLREFEQIQIQLEKEQQKLAIDYDEKYQEIIQTNTEIEELRQKIRDNERMMDFTKTNTNKRIIKEKEIRNDSLANLQRYINRVVFKLSHEHTKLIKKSEMPMQSISSPVYHQYKRDPLNQKEPDAVKDFIIKVFALSMSTTLDDIYCMTCEEFDLDVEKTRKEWILTDIENNDLSLLMNVRVHSFFRNESYSSAVLIFRPKNNKLTLLTKPQVTIVEKSNKEANAYNSTFARLQETFNNLIEAKPGLDTYAPAGTQIREKMDNLEGSTLSLMFYLTVLVLMWISLGKSSSVSDRYYVRSPIFNNFYLSSPGGPPDIYNNLMTYYDYNRVYNTSTGVYDADPVFNSYLPIGTKRVVQSRVQHTNCPLPAGLSQNACPYESYYTSSTKDTTSYGNYSWQKYQTEAETLIPSISGVFSSYGGDGYMFEVSNNTNMDMRIFVQGLESANYIDQGTRAITISFLLYELNLNYFVQFTQLIEINYLGIIEPSVFIYTFKLNYKDENESLFSLDIAKVILLAIIIFEILLRKVWNKGEEKRNWGYLLSLPNLINLLIFSLTLSSIIVFYKVPSQSKLEILQSTEFIELSEYGQNYDNAATLQVWALIILSFKLLMTFVFSRTIRLFLLIFRDSYQDLAYYLTLLVSVFLGIAIIAIQVWGIYYHSFSDFFSALYGIFSIFSLNNLSVRQEILSTNKNFGTGLIIFIVFIIYFTLNSSFLAIIMERFRILSLKLDNQSESTVFMRRIDRYTEILQKFYKSIKCRIFSKRRLNLTNVRLQKK